MAHNHHPHCGCAACCDVELADERRDEYIDQFAPEEAAKIIASDDFAWDALNDLGDDAASGVTQDVARFFERYHALREDDMTGAVVIARDLYLSLLPIIQAAADEQARDKVAAEYDRSEAA